MAAGQRNTARAAAATDQELIHSLSTFPRHCPHAVFVIGQAEPATLDTQNTVVPPSGVAIGLLIAISLSSDRT